ncbi:MAG: IS4 family transposase, partial [Armatimonadota bacterium]
VAWRLLWLTYLSRAAPEQPCTVAFTDLEWRVLHLAVREIDPHFLRQSNYEASSGLPPALRTAVRWLGKLGGFLGRKGDGEPGIKVLWHGLATLNNIVLGAMIAQECKDRCV